MNITDLQPAAVFRIFSEICAIPHGSGNMEPISEYCESFAGRLGLKHRRDSAGNIVIYKNGTAGYENSETVILQGHLDMVCEKNADCSVNMELEGVSPRTDGEYVWAEGTTLGGDDGIAVAYILSVLAAEDIPHPPIEALFTVDEEIGLLGANALDASMLTGKILLNIDSEEEGILTVSCAGGVRASCEIPIKYESGNRKYLKISISGLQGGHSGMDIDKHRRNAVKILARLLACLHRRHGINLCSFSGGGKDNVIPNRAEAVIACDAGLAGEIAKDAEGLSEKIKRENIAEEPHMEFSCSETKEAAFAGSESSGKIIFALAHAPDGICEMSPDMAGMVRTSLNMGTVFMDAKSLHMRFFIRSSSAAEKAETAERLEDFVGYLGGKTELAADYPAWEYKADSPLRETMIRVYKEVYGSEPLVQAIHAGLECGILASKLPDTDMISFGPDIKNAHTTEEKLDAASAARCYGYLLKVLENLK